MDLANGRLLAAVASMLWLWATPGAAHGYTVLHYFCAQSGCTDGASPNGVVEDAKGNFFGTTWPGGANNDGVVFEMSPARHGAYTYKVLYDFCAQQACADGALPVGSLVIDTRGNLYGVTSEGGTSEKGNVFELVHRSGRWVLKTLVSFCQQPACADGEFPQAGLSYAGQQSGAFYDPSLPLFGTTSAIGGTGFGGTVYMIQHGSGGWTQTVLHGFCPASCGDGSVPEAPLLVDSSNNLFGTTMQGGASNGGTVFEISPNGNGWSETVLHSFCAFDCADGTFPGGGVAMDVNGILYGFANGGGLNCPDRDHGPCGLVYSLVPDGAQSAYTVLYEFGQNNRSDDGANPSGAPVLDATGNIFGTTTFGGTAGNGVLFRLSGSTLKVLHTFCIDALTDGCEPSGLVREPTGKIFGTTFFGGPNDDNGVAYSYAR